MQVMCLYVCVYDRLRACARADIIVRCKDLYKSSDVSQAMHEEYIRTELMDHADSRRCSQDAAMIQACELSSCTYVNFTDSKGMASRTLVESHPTPPRGVTRSYQVLVMLSLCQYTVLYLH